MRTTPLIRWFGHESAGGVVLALAALAALGVSNSPLWSWYQDFLHTPGSIVFGRLLVLEKTLVVWINDLLMAVFFFVVGLEIKREFVEGELASRRQAVLPAAAALAEPVTLGIALGLVVGKAVGVFGAAWLLIRSGVAVMPAGASPLQLLGVCVLAGLGFTMSLFIGGLAFEGLDAAYEARLKLGVLGGSLISALIGAAVLLSASPRRSP